MEKDRIVESLKNKAQTNACANAVFHVWAVRQRARNMVTMASLTQKMTEEKFTFPRAEYEQFLKFLGGLGLGTLEVSRTGRVVALKNIKISLQSIGLSAVGHKEALQVFRTRKRFERLPIVTGASMPSAEKASEKKAPTSIQTVATPIENTESGVIIRLMVRGKPLELAPNPEWTTEDLVSLIERLRDKKSGAAHGRQ